MTHQSKLAAGMQFGRVRRTADSAGYRKIGECSRKKDSAKGVQFRPRDWLSQGSGTGHPDPDGCDHCGIVPRDQLPELPLDIEMPERRQPACLREDWINTTYPVCGKLARGVRRTRWTRSSALHGTSAAIPLRGARISPSTRMRRLTG